MTQTGIVTRSTKKGNKDTFHELVFEDKKDAEFIRLQSERDYKETIKNNAEITIGLEHQDKGDLTQTIHRNKTETLNTGDHTFTVKDGNQTIKIKKDHKETIEGKSTQTITGKTVQTIKMGDVAQTLDMGKFTQTVKMGNWKTEVKMGNSEHKTTLGKHTIEALQKIELKCGASKITMTPAKITVSSVQVEVKGNATAKVQGGAMASVEAGGMLKLKGGITMIN